jgi:hypothetical protein
MSNTDFPDVTTEPVNGDPFAGRDEAGAIPKNMPVPGEATISATTPSWRQWLAQKIIGDTRASPEKAAVVHGLLGTTGLDQPSMSVADVVPGVGQALQAQEAVKGGDYTGAAIAVLPGAGMAGREVMAGGNALKRALLAAPGSLERNAAERSLTGEADRISTRVPWAVGAPDAHADASFQSGLAASQSAPVAFERNADRIRGYGGTQIDPNLSAADTSEAFIEHAKSNLLALHDGMDPAVRDEAALWYDGANDVAHGLARDYSLEPRQAAGVIAAQSPQKDWYQNVSLGHRIIDINHHQQMTAITPEMNDFAQNYIAKRADKPEGIVAQDFLDRNQGVPYGQMQSDVDKAHFIRFYDEAHNGRGYDIVSPRGEVRGPQLNADGVTPSRVGWGSMEDIRKGVSVLQDGSRENISRQMGDAHKVRNFYNNIIAPYSPAGDVTVDTHAIAGANLYPLTGNDTMTTEGLGQGGSAAAAQGTRGLYGLYQEAFQRAAAERGVQPRQMQSITWEGARGLFPGDLKARTNYRAGIEKAWQDHEDGISTLAQGQQGAIAAAGGIRTPDWAVSLPRSHAAAGYPADARELPAGRVYGRATGPAWRGTGRAAPPTAPAQGLTLEPVAGDPFGG